MVGGSADVVSGAFEHTVNMQFKGQPMRAFVLQGAAPQIVLGINPKTMPNFKSVADLKGKKVTFGSVGSTSQHLGPAQVLTDLGLTHGTDYTSEIISRNVAVEALIRGDVAAVGMNESHLKSIREAFPEQSFTVIARGRDLPNDVLVARAGLEPAVIEKVREAFKNDGAALMEAVLQGDDNKKYEGGFFLTGITDADYDYVRAMYKTIGVDTKAFIE